MSGEPYTARKNRQVELAIRGPGGGGESDDGFRHSGIARSPNTRRAGRDQRAPPPEAAGDTARPGEPGGPHGTAGGGALGRPATRDRRQAGAEHRLGPSTPTRSGRGTAAQGGDGLPDRCRRGRARRTALRTSRVRGAAAPGGGAAGRGRAGARRRALRMARPVPGRPVRENRRGRGTKTRRLPAQTDRGARRHRTAPRTPGAVGERAAQAEPRTPAPPALRGTADAGAVPLRARARGPPRLHRGL